MKKIDVRRGEVRGPGWEEVMVFRWPVNKHQRHLVTGPGVRVTRTMRNTPLLFLSNETLQLNTQLYGSVGFKIILLYPPSAGRASAQGLSLSISVKQLSYRITSFWTHNHQN